MTYKAPMKKLDEIYHIVIEENLGPKARAFLQAEVTVIIGNIKDAMNAEEFPGYGNARMILVHMEGMFEEQFEHPDKHYPITGRLTDLEHAIKDGRAWK